MFFIIFHIANLITLLIQKNAENIKINIFSIFGLILASGVGIDYVIFALYKSKIRAVFGIILASLTSIISFVILATSQFGALFAFGIATSLCMCFCALFASIFAIRKFR